MGLLRRMLGSDLALPAAIAVASRLLVLTIIAAFPSRMMPQIPPASMPPFAIWDGAWYAAIAAHGYHAEPLARLAGGPLHDFAFFPAWPALLAAVGAFGIPIPLAAGLLANGLFVAAVLVAYRAFTPTFGRRGTLIGLALLAAGPAGYVFSLGYTESLFLLLVALAFHPATRRYRPLLVVVASATRLVGPALSMAALARAAVARRRPTRAEFAEIAAGPLTFLAWWAFIAVLTGNPAGYLLGSPGWYAATGQLAGPGSFLAIEGFASLFAGALALGALAVPIAGFLLLLRARRFDLAACVAAMLLPTLLLASWTSMPRHALAALPAFLAAGAWLDGRPRATLAVVGLGVVGMIVIEVWVLRAGWTP